MHTLSQPLDRCDAQRINREPLSILRPISPLQITWFNQRWGGTDAAAVWLVDRVSLRGRGDLVRSVFSTLGTGEVARQRPYAGDRLGYPGRRARLPQPPIPHD